MYYPDCATLHGWKVHKDRNEPCQICKDWKARYDAGLAAPPAPTYLPVTGRARCGTPGGYNRHRRNGEPACRECLDHMAERYRERTGARPLQLKPCGTPAAYQRHKYKGEEPCEPCTIAYKADHAERKARKKAEREAQTKELVNA